MANEQVDKLRATLVRAAQEVERLRGKVAELEGAGSEPIAIVGIGLRLPGRAVDLDSFWAVLERGEDVIERVPGDRWDADAIYDPNPDALGKSYTREGAFIEDVDCFDAAFFNISPREAATIDPQHRLLLETSWQALEHAGIVPATLSESATGVFVGLGPIDYGVLQQHAGMHDAYEVMNTQMSFSAGRVAYHLGLQGPAFPVATACSSSLVALHLASQSLRARECELALVGAVQVMVDGETFVHLSRTHALAPDGRCKTFSAGADGYGRGEGVVTLVLERLSRAEANGRDILAIIRGSAINHDGASSGIMAPNGLSQQKVLRAALSAARLSASDIDFVECNGTGTKLGDPIEVQALAAVYGKGRSKQRPLHIGALKTNIGHLEPASGLAAIAKLIASLRHEALPPTLHTRPRNPHVDWDEIPIEVVERRQAWPRRGPESPRRAGLSAFGMSGTNAHIILEEPPTPTNEAPPSETPALLPFVLSGRTVDALRRQAARLRAHLDARSELRLVDLAFSLATSRSQFEQRACVVAGSRAELGEALDALAAGVPHPAYVDARARRDAKLAFVYPGHGTDWDAFGPELFESSPSFRDALQECARALEPHTGWSVLDVIQRRPGAPSLQRVDVAQPVAFALMLALTAVWRELGVRPDSVVGHSQGELAAAVSSGALSLADAALVIAKRSELAAAQLGDGAMAAVFLPASALADELGRFGDRVAIAADNGPESFVVAGEREAIDALLARAVANGFVARKISDSYASHWSGVERLAAPLRLALRELRPRPVETPMLSSVKLTNVAGPELDAHYWYRNLRDRVRFAEVVDALAGTGHEFFLELGPQAIVAADLRAVLDRRSPGFGTVVASLRAHDSGFDRVLRSLGELHCHGYAIDWAALFAQSAARRVALPTYAFARTRYWIEPRRRPASERVEAPHRAGDGHPLLGRSFRMSTPPDTTFWERGIVADPSSWTGQHSVDGGVVFPLAGMLEMLLAATRELAPTTAVLVEQLRLHRVLALPNGDPARVQVALVDAGAGAWSARIAEAHEDRWYELATARVAASERDLDSSARALADARAASDLAPRSPADLYALLERIGVGYGPSYRRVESLRIDAAGTRALARLSGSPDADAYFTPPTLLDAALQAVSALALADPESARMRLPVAIDHVWIAGPIRGPLWVSVTSRTGSLAPSSLHDLDLWSDDGRLLGRVEALRTDVVAAQELERRRAPDLLELAWAPFDPSPAPSNQRWLVLDAGERGHQLVAQLRSQGADAELIDASALTEPARIVARLDAALTGPAQEVGVVCVWPLAASDPASAGQVWTAGLALARELGSRMARARPRLVFVTTNARAPDGGPGARPEQSLLWSLGASLRAELTQLRPARIDLGDEHGPSGLATVAKVLLGIGDEDQIAIHDATPLRARLRLAPRPADARVSFSRDSSYLVSGPVDPAALTELAERGAGQLVLLAPGPELDAAALAEIEAAGALVRVTSTRPSDTEALAVLLRELGKDRPLRGVIHRARELAGKPVDEIDGEDVRAAIEDEAAAAASLDRATAGVALDFFVLEGSGAALLGTPKEALDGAIGAFFAGLAKRRRSLKQPALALTWIVPAPGTRGRGLADYRADERVRLLLDSLATDCVQRSPCRLAVHELVDYHPSIADWPVLADLLAQAPIEIDASTADVVASLRAASPEQRRERLLSVLLFELAAVLRTDPAQLDPDSPFATLGVDSLMGVELRNRMKAETGVEVPATAIWTHPTPQLLSEHLAERLAESPAVAEPRSAPSTSKRHAPVELDADDDSLLAELEALEGLLDA